jgi:hypothetical protein
MRQGGRGVKDEGCLVVVIEGEEGLAQPPQPAAAQPLTWCCIGRRRTNPRVCLCCVIAVPPAALPAHAAHDLVSWTLCGICMQHQII